VTEREAWDRLVLFASTANVSITREMSVNVLRRTLAKKYQPRRATDDDSAMRQINGCIDIVDAKRSQLELCGAPDPSVSVKASKPAPGQPVWQTDNGEDWTISAQDYSDVNFIRKQIYDRSVRFGDVELLKAWAWDGLRFQKVVGLMANDFSLEEIGRALLYHQVHGPDPSRCNAVFLTKGAGRVREFRLLLLRMGRLCEDVSKYHFVFSSEPDAPDFAYHVSMWLKSIEKQLDADRAR
jgi:hypothetical protein